jgi:hypothetical protein
MNKSSLYIQKLIRTTKVKEEHLKSDHIWLLLGNKDGLILPFTMLILILLILVGVVVLANTNTAIVLSGQNKASHDTFNAADTAAQVATLLTKILMNPELGSPQTVLNYSSKPKFPLKVEINEDRFKLSQILSESNKQSYTDRYLETGWNKLANVHKPHLRFLVNGQEVATAVVQIDDREQIPDGSGMGQGDSYDSSTTSNKYITIVVSVRGWNNYRSFPNYNEPNTIITSMFRDNT